MSYRLAPALDVVEWVNGPPMTLEELRGRVVMIETFQMLCPGCVSHGIPQAKKVHASMDPEALVVLGLHTVFEHHDVMGSDALGVFLSEYKVPFPVGIDRHQEGEAIPLTMRRYGLQGTPSTVLIDRQGRIRFSNLGAVDDFVLGASIGQLLGEPAGTMNVEEGPAPVCRPGAGCE